MEAFASVIEDEKLQSKLFYALNHKKPFANFKWKIGMTIHFCTGIVPEFG
jgi:hypothetical protein